MKPIFHAPKALFCEVEEQQWQEIASLAQAMEVDLGYLTREAALLGMKILKERYEIEKSRKNIAVA